MTKLEQVLGLAGVFVTAFIAILGVVGSGLDWLTPPQAVRVMALGGILGAGLILAVNWMTLMRMRSIAEDEDRTVPVTRYLRVGVASLGYVVVLFLVVNDFF